MFWNKKKKRKKLSKKEIIARKKQIIEQRAKEEASLSMNLDTEPVAQHQQQEAAVQSKQLPKEPRSEKNWMQKKMDVAAARADHYLTIEDELPLHQHLLLFIIVAFVVFFCIWANFRYLYICLMMKGSHYLTVHILSLSSCNKGTSFCICVRKHSTLL